MQINWNTFIINLLPKALRTSSMYGFIRALLAPLVDIYNQYLKYDADVKYKLKHNSQVWSIQSVLNDAFDIDQRRIYIKDSGGDRVVLLNLDADDEPVILNTDDDKPLVIHNDSAYEGSQYDFIVVLPYVFSDAELHRLRALVNFYKLAGKRYDIIVERIIVT